MTSSACGRSRPASVGLPLALAGALTTLAIRARRAGRAGDPAGAQSRLA